MLDFIDMKNLLFALITLLTGTTMAQDQGYIYGKVSTLEGNSYEGQIRWGKEEAFWDDEFNSEKDDNEYVKYLSRDDYQQISQSTNSNNNWNLMNIWENESYVSFDHIFSCRFGDIDKLVITGRDAVDLYLKNGKKMELDGGSNDVGTKIIVADQEMGTIDIPWGKITEIQFMETPRKLKNKLGEPLTGTLVTDNGTFSGLIQWDHEECLSEDKLDGDNEDGDVSIKFGVIKSIEKSGRGSEVVLKSGRKFYLINSNDVNSDNRGVVVKVPEIGKILVQWGDFQKVTFDDEPKGSGPGYDEYGTPEYLSGTIKTRDGESYSGRLVYDLDETWDMEMLQGDDGDTEFTIPFRNIKRITPKNFSYSTIELRSGASYLLGEAQDVSDRNDGLLVFSKNGDDPKYVSWKKVETITFR